MVFEEPEVIPDPPQPPEQKSWWGRNWKWALPVGCVVTPMVTCVGFMVVAAVLVFTLIKSSGAYTESLQHVRQHPQAQAALGTPIEPGYLVMGNIDLQGNRSGHADISYSVSGPKNGGWVYAVADKSAGKWVFTTLEMEVENTSQRIDLLDKP